MDIYVLVQIDADSWTGGSRPVSYHATIDSAMEALPDFVKKDLTKMERECYGKQVRNYSYNSIEKHELQGAPDPRIEDVTFLSLASDAFRERCMSLGVEDQGEALTLLWSEYVFLLEDERLRRAHTWTTENVAAGAQAPVPRLFSHYVTLVREGALDA